MMQDMEVVETEPNRVMGAPDQICFKLPAEDKTAFMSRLARDGEKATPLLRAFVRDYMAKGRAEASLSLAARKRAELQAYIMEALRDYAAANKDHGDLLEWMDKGLGLRPGTLYSLLEY